MMTEKSPQWYLRKHLNGEIFGPVAFDQIREWAMSAQVHPQDAISNDASTWNKAPMLEDLHMDWLVEVTGQPLYGPTTAGTLLEFLSLGEISAETKILNCCSGEMMRLGEASFFPNPTTHAEDARNQNSNLKESLQNRIMELESALLHKQTELNSALDGIARLKRRVEDLESTKL
jgi:hypothetical protein